MTPFPDLPFTRPITLYPESLSLASLTLPLPGLPTYVPLPPPCTRLPLHPQRSVGSGTKTETPVRDSPSTTPRTPREDPLEATLDGPVAF